MKSKLSVVATVVAGFIAGAAAVVAILQWYETPKGRLHATFAVNAYEAPPIKRDSVTKLEAPRGHPRVVLAKPEWFALDRNPIGGFLDGRIQNSGSKDIQHVVLTIPEAIYVCIERASKDWSCQEFTLGPDAVVTIGDLRPLESTFVQIWLSSEPTPNLVNGITLTHSEGVGRIAFQTVAMPTSGTLGLLLSIGVSALTGLAVGAVAFQLVEVNRRLDRLKKREDVEPSA